MHPSLPRERERPADVGYLHVYPQVRPRMSCTRPTSRRILRKKKTRRERRDLSRVDVPLPRSRGKRRPMRHTETQSPILRPGYRRLFLSWYTWNKPLLLLPLDRNSIVLVDMPAERESWMRGVRTYSNQPTPVCML